MWILKNLKTGKLTFSKIYSAILFVLTNNSKFLIIFLDGVQYFVNPNLEKHVVGRQEDVSLPLAGDQTISRVHAILFINDDKLEVLDEGSKYKVFLNHNIESKRPMTQMVRQRLTEGDRILFGRANHLFQVQKFNLNVTASTLLDDDRKELKTLLLRLGGEIAENITTSTSHLVMPSITITSKLIFALVHCIPVVTVDYWRKVCDAADNNETFPNPKDFVPELKEAFLRDKNVSFGVDIRRKSLFRGKTFYFFSQRQYDFYLNIIQGGGGKCVALKAATLKKAALVGPNIVVFLHDSVDHAFPGFTQRLLEECEAYARAKGHRFIPTKEINLAIIHCNIEKYCNPRYKFEENIATQEQTERNFTPLAGESATIETPMSEDIDTLLLPETDAGLNLSQHLTPRKNNQLNSQKRKLEAIEAKFTKRRKIEEEYASLPRCPPNRSGSWLNKSTVEPVIAPEGTSTNPGNFDISKLFEDEDSSDGSLVSRKRPAEDNGDINGDDDAIQTDENGFQIKRKKLNPEETTNGDGEFGIISKRKEINQAQESIPTISLTDGSTTVNGVSKHVDISLYHQPIQVPSTGWLSASFGKMQVKEENEGETVQSTDDIKKEIDEEDTTFNIEVKPMVLVSKPVEQTSAYNFPGSKNYKAFQKKKNYHSQTHLLNTVNVKLGFSQATMI